MGRAGAIPKAFHAFGVLAFQPAVMRPSADAVVAAGRRDVAADFLDMPQHGELVFSATLELTLGRRGES